MVFVVVLPVPPRLSADCVCLPLFSIEWDGLFLLYFVVSVNRTKLTPCNTFWNCLYPEWAESHESQACSWLRVSVWLSSIAVGTQEQHPRPARSSETSESQDGHVQRGWASYRGRYGTVEGESSAPPRVKPSLFIQPEQRK